MNPRNADLSTELAPVAKETPRMTLPSHLASAFRRLFVLGITTSDFGPELVAVNRPKRPQGDLADKLFAVSSDESARTTQDCFSRAKTKSGKGARRWSAERAISEFGAHSPLPHSSAMWEAEDTAGRRFTAARAVSFLNANPVRRNPVSADRTQKNQEVRRKGRCVTRKRQKRTRAGSERRGKTEQGGSK
jgi:hypothetical protein